MSTNNLFRSDLYNIHNIVQNSMILQPKEAIIASLREYFAEDTYYHFSKDQWGFPNTPDHTDLPINAGINNELSTRLFIGEQYRQDKLFYPAILVKSGGSSYVPISMNREAYTVDWDFITVVDGYGNLKNYHTPKSYIFAGAWEGTISVEIRTKSLRARDDLIDLCAILFQDIGNNNLIKSGVAIKKVSASGPSESDDRTDKLFMQSLNLEIRTEWRREVPVSSVVEVINTTLDFVRLDNPNAVVAQNLTANSSIDISEVLLSM